MPRLHDYKVLPGKVEPFSGFAREAPPGPAKGPASADEDVDPCCRGLKGAVAGSRRTGSSLPRRPDCLEDAFSEARRAP